MKTKEQKKGFAIIMALTHILAKKGTDDPWGPEEETLWLERAKDFMAEHAKEMIL